MNYYGKDGFCSMSLLSKIADSDVTNNLMGDVNQDGEFNVSDVIILQKWLLGTGELHNWQNADFNHDEMLNIFDFLAMKKMLLEMQID